jgi:hypothetical protein
MRPGRHLLLLALAAGLAASLSCDANDAAGPSNAASLAKTATPPPSTPTEAQLKEKELQLKARELEEKARVAAAQEASKAVYDALKPEWERLVKLYPNGITGESGPVYCDPLQYASDVKIIGPEGGDMSIGPHKLSIPKGALTDYVVITGEMPVSMAVTVRLSPEGLAFAKQPLLTLSYKHCLRPIYYRERVAYTDEELNPLEFPHSYDLTLDGLVNAWLDHFSRYAVWY